MGRILRLPEHVANQIAAGEVVERPASVVKELVENAIDAEAERITIEVSGLGLDLLRISDDGLGMSPEDARLALERHATSKIRGVDDLSRIRSLGFRGEALPSIASVCRLLLRTTERGAERGAEIRVEGGRIVHEGEGAAVPGTTIEVTDLFYNVPARKKFLKRRETEMSHVAEVVERLALAHPEVAIRLSTDGRVALDAPRATPRDVLGRLARVLGRATAERLIPIELVELGGVLVRGFVGDPELTERTSRGLRLFVNGRFVRDRTMQAAVTEAYKGHLPSGRHPVALVFLVIDPAKVDVNVHPQKFEVRFQSAQEVYRAVHHAVTKTLAERPGREGPSALREARAPLEPAAGSEPPSIPSPGRGRPSPGYAFGGHARALSDALGGLVRDRPASEGPAEPPGGGLLGILSDRSAAPELGASERLELQPMGQVLGDILVAADRERVVLVDLPRAERVLRLHALRDARRQRRPIEAQRLLLPEVLPLAPSDRAALGEVEGELQALGFAVEPSDEGVRILAVPAGLPPTEAIELVLEIAARVAEGEPGPDVTRRIEAALDAALHKEVRPAPRVVPPAEARALLAALSSLPPALLTARPRPVWVEWTRAELGRLFGRP